MVDARRQPAPLPSVVLGHRLGLPEAVSDAGTSEPDQRPSGGTPYAAWGQEGELLVVTWGSSRCPQLPVSVEVEEGAVVVATQMYLPGGPCTRDLVPTTSSVAVPTEVDALRPVVISIDGVQTQLDPR